MRYTLVHRKKDVVRGIFGGLEQLAILLAFEAGPLNCMRLMPPEAHGESPAADTRQGALSCHSGEQGLLRFLKRLNCHLARDRRKLPEKFAQRMTSFKVIDEILERYPCTAKARGPIHHVGITDNRLGHALYCTVFLDGSPSVGGLLL